MLEVMTIGAVALVLLAMIGVATAWGLARLMDRANFRAQERTGRWFGVLSLIESEPLSASIYYGARWLGICILIGWLFSRAV